MKLIDICVLSWKGIKIKKTRTILSIILVAIGIFLINMFLMMSGCIVDTERMKTEDNHEFREITIYPTLQKDKDNGQISGIDLYKLFNIKNIEGIESVFFGDIENKRYDESYYNIKYIQLNKCNFTPVLNNFTAQYEINCINADFDKIDLFDRTKVEYLCKNRDEYQEYIWGERVENESGECQVLIDNITAMRFFSYKFEKEQDWGFLSGENVSFYLENGDLINARIVGVYDYRNYLELKQVQTEEERVFEKNFVNFRYSDEELVSNKFTTEDICLPIIVNEVLAKKITLQKGPANYSTKYASFSNYKGTLQVVVSSIEKIDAVIEELRAYGYVVDSQVELAKNSVDRMFFYKNLLAIIGVVIIFITIIQIINIMLMVVHERQEYMDMLSRLGYDRRLIRNIISFESIWIGVIGSVVGVGFTYISKNICDLQLHHALEESGLYRYVYMKVGICSIMVSIIGSVLISYSIGLILTKKKI